MRLNRVILFVKDLPRMAAFYGDTLGCRPIDDTRTDAWAEFDAGTMLGLHSIPPQIAAEVEINSPPVAREGNPVKLVFEVEDVERERQRLMALGITMMQRSWGACDGVDPEGNIFQICPIAENRGD